MKRKTFSTNPEKIHSILMYVSTLCKYISVVYVSTTSILLSALSNRHVSQTGDKYFL